MEIQETKAYSIPFINIDQNSTLMFKDEATRNSYFNANGTTLTNNVVKDVWRLYVDYLMTEGIPYPKAGTYNYFRFKLKRGGYLFFYVYDYEIKGAGQILYKLKLDTLQTYYLHSNDFQPIGEQIVYREHKDRFDTLERPIIDQTLESLDIKPRIVEHVKTYQYYECKLALAKVGGGVKDGNVLSKAAYFWKVYSPFPYVTNLQVNNQDFELLLGWGVRTDVNAENNKIRLLFIAESGATANVEIEADSYVNFRFGINSDGYQTLFLISGDNWEGLYTASGDVIVSRYLNDPTELRFHTNGRLYINLVQSTSTFMIRFDAGIYETAPYFDQTQFLKFIPSGGDAEPFHESALNPQAAETQQIISIPNIQMLNLKGFGSNGGKGVYIPLNKEINEQTYDAETEITNLTPNFTTTFQSAMTRVKYNDPKLLHSQFNTLFFTLQNEQIPLKLENTRNNKQIKLKLNLNVSNYSKALLKLENGGNNMIYNELYELEKVINMNNEYATIKSEINDYIDLHSRNDQRLNELQTSKAERDLVYKGVGQVVSIGGGIAAGAISGSIVPGVGTVAGAVVGAATGIVKGALNIAQGIQNLNQLKEEIKLQYDSKIKGLAYSLINITGLTPDLAEKQNTNRLKLFQFKLLNYEKDYLDLYFHNFGYQTLEYKMPNLRSRKYFNFIQMELVNYHINSRLITAEVIEDIRLRFRTGVTLFHYNEADIVRIDTQKQYENFERKFETPEIVEWEVSFEVDGELLKTLTIEDGNKVEPIADPEKAGFIFKGWLLDGELFNFEEELVTSDITLVASFEEFEEKNNYVKFVSAEARTITPTYTNSGVTLQYSVDSGVTWTTIASGASTTSATEHWFIGQATGTKSLFTSTTFSNAWAFSGSSDLEVYGNLNFLLCDTLGDTEAPTSLGDYCYNYMFYNCTSLTTPPELPATTLASNCYREMFYNCTSLTTPPELPATTLASNCYREMFYGCTSLTTAPELPATTLANYCYNYMFSGCTSLTVAPELPATTFRNYCYAYMFSGCTSFKVSATNTGTYTYAWRIPTSGTGAEATNWNIYMLRNTGGTFTDNPTINKTYWVVNKPV